LQPALQRESPEPGEITELSVPPPAQPQEDTYAVDRALRDIIRTTQSWVQLGTLGFAILCILIGAVEALFGR